MQVNGITWHATVVAEDKFDAMKSLAIDTMGLTPMMEFPGVAVFVFPDGTLYELPRRRHRDRLERAGGSRRRDPQRHQPR